MADSANSIRNLQEILKTYSYYDGNVQDQASPELIEAVYGFLNDFRSLQSAQNGGGSAIPDNAPYTPAQAQEISKYLQDNLPTMETRLANDQDTATQYLQSINAPQHFIDNPSLFVQLAKEDIGQVLDGMNALSAAGVLTPPGANTQAIAPVTRVDPAENQDLQNMSPQGIRAWNTQQAENLESLETQILDLSDVMLQSLNEGIASREEALEAEGADTATLELEIEALTQRRDRLQSATAELKQNGADGTWDAVTEKALSGFVQELQHGGLRYAMADGSILSTEWNRERDGGYSQAYHDFLYDKIKVLGQRITEINEKQAALEDGQELSDADKQALRGYDAAADELFAFADTIGSLKTSGFIEFAPDQLSAIVFTISEKFPILEDTGEALSIVTTALKNLQDNEKLYFNPNLSADVDDYDMEARQATQALILQIAEDLDIDIRDGRYSPEFRAGVSQALQDEENRAMIAEKYFSGEDDALVQTDRLLLALNTLSVLKQKDTPDAEQKYINRDQLIYKPDLKDNEVEAIKAVTDTMAPEEIAAMSHMSRIMTNFGLQHLMPEGTLSPEQIEAIESTDPEAALAAMYKNAHAQALAESGDIEGEDLEDRITEILRDKFDALYNDIDSFDFSHKVQLRADIRQAIEDAVRAPDGTDLDAAAAIFTDRIPDYKSFTEEQGIGQRDDFDYDAYRKVQLESEFKKSAELQHPPQRASHSYTGDPGAEKPLIENIAFIMDDIPGKQRAGVYVDTNYGRELQMEMSAGERVAVEVALGINLDDKIEEAYNDHGKRFFAMAIHPDNETVPGGLIIGFREEDGNSKYTYLKSDMFNLRNHINLSEKLSAEYIYQNNSGYDRLGSVKVPSDNDAIQGILIDKDNSVSEMLRFDKLKQAMNLANWIGDGYHETHKERVENGTQDHHPVHSKMDFRENAESLGGTLPGASQSAAAQPPHPRENYTFPNT